DCGVVATLSAGKVPRARPRMLGETSNACCSWRCSRSTSAKRSRGKSEKSIGKPPPRLAGAEICAAIAFFKPRGGGGVAQGGTEDREAAAIPARRLHGYPYGRGRQRPPVLQPST